MYLLSGKIKCINCGKNYIGRIERKRQIYLCSGYHNKTSDCERFAIREEEIIEIVRKHFETNNIDVEQINIIEVDDKEITIKYSDASCSILSSSRYIV